MKTSAAFYKFLPSLLIKVLLVSIGTIAISFQAFAQPTWQNGTPTVTPKPMSIDLTFNLDRPSYVYYNITRSAYPLLPLPPAANVKFWASQPVPFGAIDHNGIITYNAGDVGNDVTINVTGEAVPIVSDHTYGIIICAEDQATGTLTISYVTNVTTLSCPDFWLDINFSPLGECISVAPGIRAYFEASEGNPIVEPESGVYPGTLWHVDWGDGQSFDYESLAYDDFPLAQLHSYAVADITDCVFQAAWSAVSACGADPRGGYIDVIAHGRDDQIDGVLDIVNDADGSNIIQICEGTSETIILRDASTWNCQNPILSDLTPGPPNDDPRDLQWIYGKDPTIENTGVGWDAVPISGTVLVDGNDASTAGYNGGMLTGITAVGETSGSIVIPATCRAGETFTVFLKNWNKCNPYSGNAWTGNAIYTQIVIEIIDGPLADAGADDSVCEGFTFNMDGSVEDATSSLWTTTTNGIFGSASSPGGATYTPGSDDISAGEVDLVLHAYASGSCPEHTDTMTLTIDPLPAKPAVQISGGSNNFCDDDATTLFIRSTIASPTGTYRWERNGTEIVGATGRTLALNDYTQSGNYTVTIYALNGCPNESDPFLVTIYQMATVTTQPSNATTCENSNASFTAISAGPAHNRRWQRKVGAGAWNDLSDDGTYSGTTTQTLTISGAATSLSGNQFRIKLTTTTGGCDTYSNAATLTVVPGPTAFAGNDAIICENETYQITDAAVSNQLSYSWSIINGNGGLNNIGILNPTYTPGPSDEGTTVTLELTVIGTAPCTPSTDRIDIFVDAIPVATTNASQQICVDINAFATLQGNTGGSDLLYGASGLWTFPTIWNENFNDLADGTTSDAGPTAWSRAIGNTGPGWYAEVRSGAFETTRNRTNWISQIINISAFTDVSISIDFSSYATGNGFEDPQDYYDIRYYIDGLLTPIYSGNGAVDGSVEAASKAFRTVNIGDSGINGTNLRIEIITYNSAADEFYLFDNIIVAEGESPVITDPSDPASTVTNLVAGPTIFTWTVSSANGGCTPASANHIITRWDPPTASNPGSDDNVCEDVSTYTLIGNVPTYGTGAWSTTSGADITTPGAATTGVTNLDFENNPFTWTISNGICTPEANVVNIYRDRPVAPGTLSANRQICEGETPTALTGTAATGGDGSNYTYQWQYSEVSNTGPWTAIASSNTTGYSPGALTTTTWYRRLVSSGDAGCLTQQDVPSTNVIEVTVEPTLFAGAISGNQAICLGSDPDAFTSDTPASGGTPGLTYEWFSQLNSGGFSAIPGSNIEEYDPPAPALAGTYDFYRQVTSSTGYCGPEQTGQVSIIVTPGKTVGPPNVIVSDGNKCEDDSITFTYPAVANAAAYAWNFSWLGPDVDTITVTPTLTINLSIYTFASPSELVNVTCAGFNGCNLDPTPGTGDYPWSGPYNFTVYRNPDANAGTDDDVCGSLDIVLAATASVGIGTWSDLATGPGAVGFDVASSASATATATLYGTYTLEWEENNGGCIDLDTVEVIYDEQPTVTPPALMDLCDVLDTTLTATGHTYQLGSSFSPTFLWERVSGPDILPAFGSSTAVSTTVDVDFYGPYQFRITETNGTCSNSALVDVTFSENPSDASAGDTVNAACDANSVNLAGTAHTYLGGSNLDAGTSTWDYVSGLDATPSYADQFDPLTLFTVGTNQLGFYKLKWEETNGACIVRDTVVVRFFENPDGIVGSGPYAAACGDLDEDIAVTAHNYTRGEHTESTRGWSWISGPDNTPTFSAQNNPVTNVSVSTYGTYVFRWTETNGPCTQVTDVQVSYFEEPSGAAAGNDTTAVCNSKAVNLAGTAHTYVDPHPGSTSLWSVKSGPGAAVFTPATSNTAEAAVSYYGTYEFYWTETNGNCTVKDSTIVKYYENPVDASAGSNFDAACGLQSVALNGTAHIYDADPNDSSESSQIWTVFSKPVGSIVTITDDTDPKTNVSVDVYGTYIFEWTETNGNCTNSSQVTVNFYENPVNAKAGDDQAGACGFLSLVLAGTAHTYVDTPDAGSSKAWSYFSGPDLTPTFTPINLPNANVAVDNYGVYEFIWTEINGNCVVRDTMVATFYEAPTVAVSPVPDVCRDSSLAVIAISGTYGGGADTAIWSETGDGFIQNIVTGGGITTAEYVPTYNDIIAGSVTVTLTTNDPTGPCNSTSANRTINIDEAVYVVIDQAPSVFIAQGDDVDLTSAISGAGGAPLGGTWSVIGPSFGGVFTPNTTTLNVTFTPTAAQQADGGVTLVLTSADPLTACGPATDTIFIGIGANPVADAGDDLEDCEPADSLLQLSGWAKQAAGDANWSIVSGNGTLLVPQTKTWSIPQSGTPDENDSLRVDATYKLAPADFGAPSGFSTFTFELTTNDPDSTGPVTPDGDQMNYTVAWGPQTPAIGGGGLGTMCINSVGNFYNVPLTPGNDYDWEIEVLTGAGVPGVDYIVQAGGDGNNFIAIDWITVGTYNLKITETTFQTDGTTPCVGETIIKPIAVYNPPVATAAPDTTICQLDVISLRSSVTDGSGDYSYEWAPAVGLSDAFVAEPDVTGLFVGPITYTLTVRDNVSGCAAGLATVDITVNPLPALFTLTGPDYYCDGDTVGVTLILSGSEANVDYTLYNGAVPVSTITGDGDSIAWKGNFTGSYYVQGVRNAGPACARDMNGTINVTPNPAITVAVNAITEPLCNGGSNGAIFITTGGGTSPYSYSWTGPGAYSSSNEDISGIAAGNYLVTVTDSRSCTYTHDTITVGEPEALQITSIVNNQVVSCFGASDGQATVTVDPATGTAPFTYQWYYDASFSSPIAGATSNLLTSQPAATYYVIATDANFCTVNESIAITGPALLNADITATNVSCNGADDGVITLSNPSGGYAGWEYSIDGTNWFSGNPYNFAGLSPAIYTVQIRDDSQPSCIVTLSTTTEITEPTQLDITGSVTSDYFGADITCPTASDGIITVAGSGGTTAYQYNIDGGAYAGSIAFGGLAAGTYRMGIRDANSCLDSVDVDVIPPTPIDTTSIVTSDNNGFNVSCNGYSDATIQINATGGTGTLQYAIASVNGGAFQLSNTFTGLSAGSYDITIRDANGCTFPINNYILTEPTAVTATVAAVVYPAYNGRDISCFGESDGGVDVTPSGGTGVFTLQWYYNAALSSPVPGPEGIATPLENLPAGTYWVLVTDENGCSAQANGTLTNPPDLVLSTTPDIDLSCFGDSSATGTFTAAGGTVAGAYTFNVISNSAGATIGPITNTTLDFTDGSAGSVVVEVTDDNGCIEIDSIQITEPSELTVSYVLSTSPEGSHNISCFNGNDGGVTVTTIGGSGPYTYAWSTVDGGGILAGLQNQSTLLAGTYSLTVRDTKLCEWTDTNIVLIEPTELTVSVVADDSLIGACPASLSNLTATGAGGVEPGAGYNYSWIPTTGLTPATGPTPVAKPASTTTYSVLVTDDNFCTATSNVTIQVANILSASATADDYVVGTCPSSVANVSLNVNGGEPVYNYSWVNTTTSNSDDILDVVGGVAGSGASLQNPVLKPTVPGLNVYTVTITDENNCSTTANVSITLQPDLTAIASISDDTIGTCSPAILNVVGAGGEEILGGGYSYSWTPIADLDDPGRESPIFTPTVPNTTERFIVTITDRNNCTAIDSVDVFVTPDLTISSITADDDIIGTCKSAQITSVITGGEEISGGGYIYSWSPSTGLSSATIPNPVASPINTTTYTLTVTDENGCTDQQNITITVMPALSVTSVPDDYIIGECNSANITTTVTGGEPDYLGEYQYSWSPSAGLSADDIAEPVANPLVTTTYTLTVTDSNNCTAEAFFTIQVVADLSATVIASDTIIGDCNNSQLDVSVSGGEPAGGYTYAWLPNDGTLSDVNIRNPIAKPTTLGDNVYTVTVTDNNLCTVNANVTINLRDTIRAVATTSFDTIGTCPGSVTTLDVNVTSGGEEVLGGGFYYSWLPTTGLNNSSLKSPTAKPSLDLTYIVTVRDANNCIGTAQVSVAVADPLAVTVAAVDPVIGSCPGQSTILNTTVTGGIELIPGGGYTYSWSPSASLDLTDPANPVASPLSTTTYTVTVTDNNGCQANGNITIVVAPPLALSINANDILIGTCASSTSQITAMATGGEMPLNGYDYSWDPGRPGLTDYNISNPVADLTVTGFYTYVLTVTDTNLCQIVDSITIEVADPLAVTAFADDSIIGTCPTSVANLDATVSGGEELSSGGYTYIWSPATGLDNPNQKAPRAKPSATTMYTVTITDRNGCQTADSVEIVVVPDLTLDVTADDYIITAGCTSVANLSSVTTGGETTLGLDYSWSPAIGLSADDIPNPVAQPVSTSSYTLTITDDNNCTAADFVTITVQPPLNATAITDDDIISTCPTSVANLDVNATGGERFFDGSYQFSWINKTTGLTDDLTGATTKTPIAKPLATSTFEVTVTDTNGCSITDTVVVTVADPLTVIASATDSILSTCAISQSVLDATVTGGEEIFGGGYSYNWTPATGLNLASLRNPNAKPTVTTDYKVTITDRNGCTIADSVLIVVQPEITITLAPLVRSGGFNISCAGNMDGEIDATVTGGELPYVYAWTGPLGYTAGTEDINSLRAGLYQLAITDANGCTKVESVTLTEPPLLTSVISIDSIYAGGYHITCNGEADGAVSITVNGGAIPYSYNWTGPGVTVPTAQNQANLTAGTYRVTVTDDNGCQVLDSVTLVEPDILTASAASAEDFNGFDVSCKTSKDGGIDLTMAGGSGSGTYSFIWTGPDVTVPTDQNQSNLGEGQYYVDVTDLNGCTATDTIVLVAPNALNATATSPNDFNGFQVSCSGGSDGAIDLAVSEGVAPYSFAWTGPFGFVSNSRNLVGLRAGQYDVVVTDANGCTIPATITLTEPTALNATSIVTSEAVNFGWGVSCNAASDGAVDLTITGGIDTEDYAVGWTGPSGPITAEDLVNVLAGAYTATIRDSNGCVITHNVTVTEPPVLNPGQVTGDQDLCFGSDPQTLRNGFSANGGPTTLVYDWEMSTIADSANFVSVGSNTTTYTPPGNIAVTTYYRRAVTSGSCGPEYSNVLTLLVNPLPVAEMSGDTAICPNTSTDIVVDITTGTAPYTLTISNGIGVVSGYNSGDPISVAPFSAPALYELVSIIDKNGCEARAPHPNITGSATITWRDEVSVDVQPVDAKICENSDTSFSVVVTGETPYSYQWYENNVAMPLETNATLNLTNVPSSFDGNRYNVEITGGCGKTVQSDIVNLTVQTNTGIDIQPQNSDICENLATSFSVTASGTITGYQWEEFDGNTWSTLVESGTYVGTTTRKLSVFGVDSIMTGYQYKVIISGICTPTIESNPATLIVKTSPVIRTDPMDIATCETVATSFSVGADGDTLTYQWQESSGGGFSDIPPGGAYTGAQSATLTITSPQVPAHDGNYYRVIVSGACNPSEVSEIARLTVNTIPAILDHPKDEELCEDGIVTFQAQAEGTGITYHWQESTDAGTSWSDITDDGILYTGANTPSLKLSGIPTSLNTNKYRMQVRGSCATINSNAATLTVNPNPTANITGDGNFPIVCGGTPLSLDGNPAGGTGGFAKHEWTGDIFFLSKVDERQTIFSSPAHGTYNYTYTVTDGKNCIATAQATITNDRPDVRFSSDAKPSCGTVTVKFTNESTRAVAYEWDMNDPLNPGKITDESPTFDFSNETSGVSYFNVELVGFSANGCADTAIQVVTVFPSINAGFTITPDVGCNPVNATLRANTPGASNYNWNFGDGNAQQGPQDIVPHVFNNTGTTPAPYTVTLITTSFYGCVDQKTNQITVNPIPIVDFATSPSWQTYPDATVTFDNLTPTGAWTYSWNFGDGNTSTEVSPTHTYAEPGDFKVTLTAVTSECSDSLSKTVTIDPAKPIAAFTLPESDCAPLEVDFVNNSQFADQYVWDFGNGSVSYKKNPSFTYFESGIYQVKLTVYGPGGQDDTTALITVKTTPVAYTNVSPPFVFVNDVPIRGFNLSTDTINATYLWEFGDGETSDTTNPTHVYTEPGRYDVKLTVTNENTCSSEYIFSYVEVEPAGEMKFPTVFRPNQTGPADPQFKPGQDNNQIFFPGVYNQVLEYEMVIYNRWGEQIFVSKDVNIGWNGWINDTRMAEQGVYIWRVRGKYANGQNFIDVGDITLLK